MVGEGPKGGGGAAKIRYRPQITARKRGQTYVVSLRHLPGVFEGRAPVGRTGSPKEEKVPAVCPRAPGFLLDQSEKILPILPG